MSTNNFDSKAKTWDTEDKIKRAEVFASKIKSVLPNSQSLSAMEYGAGTGLVSFCLKDEFASIMLIDTSDGMLEIANQKIIEQKTTHITTQKLDLTDESIDAKFDVIYSLFTLHHIKNTEHILHQFYNLLNDGGRLFIADLDSEDGEFHGIGFDGHNGFERSHLFTLARKVGYTHVTIEDLLEVNRPELKQSYSVFSLTATK